MEKKIKTYNSIFNKNKYSPSLGIDQPKMWKISTPNTVEHCQEKIYETKINGLEDSILSSPTLIQPSKVNLVIISPKYFVEILKLTPIHVKTKQNKTLECPKKY